MTTRQRIVFLGSGAFGLPTLRWLASVHEVVAVVSQPDKPAGRGVELSPTPISAAAAASLPNVPLVRAPNVNEPETVALLDALKADAWVVIAFGQKLSKALLGGQKAMNLHASLLPRWRGAAPIHAAMIAGDPLTGNTVITLAERMDAGLILDRSEHAISPTTTVGELHDLLAADGPAAIGRALERARREWPFGEHQREADVTLAGKLSKADGWVDFCSDADTCRRRINGLSPWPGVTATFRNEPLRLLRAGPSIAQPSKGRVGEILDAAEGLIACAHGTSVHLLDVQPAGKRPMPWADFSNGKRVKPGEAIVGMSAGGAPC